MPKKKKEEFIETPKTKSLQGNYSVYKPDPILLMRDNMNLTQMRFFEAYLSKIDANDASTYKVRIPLERVAELANIDLSNRKEVKQLCEAIENSRFNFKKYRERYEPETINPFESIDRDTFPLFDRFVLGHIKGEYFIEVIPGTTMSEMLQTYQKKYSSYELQQIYSLSKKTYMRLYSCFKKLQTIKNVKISVELLKEYAGLDDDSYERTTDLRKHVLVPAVKEINEKTDITVTFSPYRSGRNVAGWNFNIKQKSGDVVAEATFTETNKGKETSNSKPKPPQNSKNATPRSKEELTSIFEKYGADIMRAILECMEEGMIPEETKAALLALVKTETKDTPTPPEQDELPENEAVGQMDVLNYIVNPLECGLQGDELQEYIEGYVECHFEDKFNEELTEFIPPDVHEYDEDNIVAIRQIMLPYVGESANREEWERQMMFGLVSFERQVWRRAKKRTTTTPYAHYISSLKYWVAENAT